MIRRFDWEVRQTKSSKFKKQKVMTEYVKLNVSALQQIG